MPMPPQDNSKMFDPQKMMSIVERLKAEGRMPTLEKLDEVLRKYRKDNQAKVRQARAKK
jgi:collagenase-like PrtC family protease